MRADVDWICVHAMKGPHEERPPRLLLMIQRAVSWSQKHLPLGARAAIGVVLVVTGLFGFLPLLGYWMIPVGGVLIALDVPPLRRRLLAWLDRPRSKRREN